MKNKKFLVPGILFSLLIVAFVVTSLLCCYTTKPDVSKGEFPFSITYEYKGETGTLSGIYKCEYLGSDTIFNEHNRYWTGESIIEYDGEYDIPNIVFQDETMTLAIHEFIEPGYVMGDPLYADWYSKHYGLDGPQPSIEYYDYINEISLEDENVNREELLEEIGFKLIDYSYPEPIENSFSFSGVEYQADNVPIFVVISFVFLILCIIFVRRDKEYKYNALDKIGIVLNFVIAIVVLPFISFFCWIYGIVGGEDVMSQITYNTPFVAITCLALSVLLRRKGVRKTGFFIQFGGIVLFILLLIIDAIDGCF